MARTLIFRRSQGFSMVELLVALVFTMILMAGMATVFKSSLSTFYTSGESIASARRNRMSLDLLYDDLNSASMALTDISQWNDADFSTNNPPFYVQPNQPITNASATGPQTTDELYIFYEQPLPFEGELRTGGGAGNVGHTAQEAVELGLAITAADKQYEIDCKDASYAKTIQAGMRFKIKDSMNDGYFNIASVNIPTGDPTYVDINADLIPLRVSPPSLVAQSNLPTFKHIATSRVVFYLPGQLVRYRIEMRDLDPSNPTMVPCLVRSQDLYSTGGFPANPAQSSIIAENVSGFKLYLSADSGQSWVGGSNPSTGAAKGGYVGFPGWTLVRGDLDSQLAVSGRSGFTTTQGNEHWFRDIPTLVRLDITTRSATQREEYSNTPGVPAYKQLTQSVVLVPRHFGLPMTY
jgi:hypothetical protein